MTDRPNDDDLPERPPFEGLEGGSPDDGSFAEESQAPLGLLKGKLSAIRSEWSVPLYRNGYLMMINTATTSVLGFAYWFIAGNLYPEDVVGQNTALISAMVLLSNIAQLNGSQILMRFAPVAGKHTRKLINLSFLAPGIASAGLAAAAAVFLHFVTNEDNPLNMEFTLAVWFVASVVGWSLFNLQDSAFIGLRRVEWVPIDNTIFGVAKVILLFPFVGLFAGFGIFVSWTLPVLLSLIPLHILLYRKFIPAQEREAKGDEPPLDKNAISKFVAWDYFGWMFAQAAGTIVPLLVVSVLGKEANAFFYMPQIIATAVDLFVINLMTSLVVEASRDLDRVAHLSRLIVKRTLYLIMPVVAFIVIAAPIFFAILPGTYGEEGTTVLRLLALATIPRMVIALSNSLSRLDQKTHQVTIVQAVQAVLIITLCLVLMPIMGINGAALAILLSATVVAVALMPRLLLRLSPRYAARTANKR